MPGIDTRVGSFPLVALGSIRLVNGVLGLFLPHVLIRRIEPAEPPSSAAIYAFRLFGVRTILLARDLLRGPGPEQANAVQQAPLIHASDAATAALLTLTGRVAPRAGAMLMAVSGLNTVLAFAARRAAQR
jgi:hypothetical protein